ncbi:MAG: hypothetical protein ACM3NW_07820, partial [Syntrophomonadaceae bacterium]
MIRSTGRGATSTERGGTKAAVGVADGVRVRVGTGVEDAVKVAVGGTRVRVAVGGRVAVSVGEEVGVPDGLAVN